MSEELELDFALDLLDKPSDKVVKKDKPVKTSRGPYPPPPQFGPLRFYDKEMRCLHNADRGEGNRRNCGRPTLYKLFGIPMCPTHSLILMNAKLHEMGIE